MTDVVTTETGRASASAGAAATSRAARHRPLPGFLPVGLLVVAIGLAFSPLYQADFIALDDPQTVWNNKLINPPTWSSIGTIWTKPDGGLYIPVTYMFWAGLSLFARAFFSTDPYVNPGVFHTFNVLTHAATSVIVFRILRLFVANRWAALAGAALFALHPVQVESVGWVSGLKDLLWGFFGTLALWHYLVSVRAGISPEAPQRAAFIQPVEMNRRRAWLHFGIATVSFVLALLCKPTAMVTPALAAALDYFLVGRRWQEVLRTLWPWALLTAPFLVLTKSVQDVVYLPGVPLAARPLIATDALAYYLTKLVLPLNLTFDPGRRPDWTWASGAPLYTWVLPAGVALLIIWQRRRRPWLVAGALVFLIALLPVLGFVPFMYQSMSTVASHYLYVSMLGPALVAAFAVAASRKTIVFASYAVLIALLSVRTTIESTYWRDNFTYYGRMVEVNPRSFFGHDGLGRAFGQLADFDMAAAHFSKALEIYPEYSISHRNLGDVLIRVGNWKGDAELILRGLDHLRKALDLRALQPSHHRPDDTQARLVIAQIYDQLGFRSEAEEQWRKVVDNSTTASAVAEARRRLAAPTTHPAAATQSVTQPQASQPAP